MAAIIFGTAVAAYLIRHFLTKRTNNMRRSGDGNSDDEEEIFPMPDELW